jgi:hypothetical protein
VTTLAWDGHHWRDPAHEERAMFPSPTRNYTRAVITGVVSLVLLIPQVIAGIRLFAGPGYPGWGPLPAFMFAMLILVQFSQAFAIVQLVRTERDLRAAMGGDDRVAPPVLTQPDRLQAGRDGERLTLERRTRTPAYWRGWGLAALVAPLTAAILVGIGEAIVFLAAPHASGWIISWVFNPRGGLMYVPPPRLTPFEWCLVASPVVPAMAVCIYLPWEQLSLRRQVITCDDQGITVKWLWRRPAFIPWSDVRLLINGPVRLDGSVEYWLRGERHGVVLDLGNGVPKAKDGKPRRPIYGYGGGIEAYEARVQRLIATIVVRAHVPLRTWASGYYQRTRNTESTPFGLTAGEVAAMPLAGALAQPLPAAVAEAAASTAPITLCANIPVRPLLRRAARYGSFFGVLFLLVGLLPMLAATGGNVSRALPGLAGPGGPILVALMLCTVYAMGILIAAEEYRTRNPAISADGKGLTVKGSK